MSEEEIKKAKADFDDYAKLINDGKNTFDEIDDIFVKDQGLEKSTAVKNTEVLDDSSIGDELKRRLKI